MNNKISLESLKFNPIRKRYDNGIEIYNLTQEMKTEILKIIQDNINENNNEEISIKEEDVLLKILPIVTNIYLPEEKEIIEEIIANPSDILEEVLSEVGDLIISFFGRVQKNLQAYESLNEEQKQLLFEKIEEPLSPTPEELKQIEEAKKLMIKYGLKE